MLSTLKRTELSPESFVRQHGEVFIRFESKTQGSGNISFGVRSGDQRWFVKTAGDPKTATSLLSYQDRIGLLRNAICLHRDVIMTDPPLKNVIESPQGPLLVYPWVDGDLLGSGSAARSDPSSAFNRFLALHVFERILALEPVFNLHWNLAQHGWIAGDFYDGCLIYDFVKRKMRVIDLDSYSKGPFENQMGRMFGSERFMAPEEHQLGAWIDERTTVFTLGRTVHHFLPDGGEEMAGVIAQACCASPEMRFANVEDFCVAWHRSRPDKPHHEEPS